MSAVGVDNDLLTSLRSAVGSDGVLVDPDVTASYQRDMMPLAPFGSPLAVVLPAGTEQVRAVVRACAAARGPIVPRGAGSGLSGAATGSYGWGVLGTPRMTRST